MTIGGLLGAVAEVAKAFPFDPKLNHKVDVQIPLMTPGMTHGVLRKWLVRTGDRIVVGQVIYELETDDAVFEVESLDFGTITTIGAEGCCYPAGALIGAIEFSEEERVDYEHFALKLTCKMREAIDHRRGDLSRAAWLRARFREFLREKLEGGKDADGGDT